MDKLDAIRRIVDECLEEYEIKYTHFYNNRRLEYPQRLQSYYDDPESESRRARWRAIELTEDLCDFLKAIENF
jgi:hypothetical protein